jgi:hypothetical protein
MQSSRWAITPTVGEVEECGRPIQSQRITLSSLFENLRNHISSLRCIAIQYKLRCRLRLIADGWDFEKLRGPGPQQQMASQISRMQ